MVPTGVSATDGFLSYRNFNGKDFYFYLFQLLSTKINKGLEMFEHQAPGLRVLQERENWWQVSESSGPCVTLGAVWDHLDAFFVDSLLVFQEFKSEKTIISIIFDQRDDWPEMQPWSSHRVESNDRLWLHLNLVLCCSAQTKWEAIFSKKILKKLI